MNTGGALSGAGGKPAAVRRVTAARQVGGAVSSTGGSGGVGGSYNNDAGTLGFDARGADVRSPDSPQLTNLSEQRDFSNGEREQMADKRLRWHPESATRVVPR